MGRVKRLRRQRRKKKPGFYGMANYDAILKTYKGFMKRQASDLSSKIQYLKPKR